MEDVRKHIQGARMGVLLSNDPAIKAAWKRIPKAGEVPTPEEVIAYYAEKMRKQNHRILFKRSGICADTAAQFIKTPGQSVLLHGTVAAFYNK